MAVPPIVTGKYGLARDYSALDCLMYSDSDNDKFALDEIGMMAWVKPTTTSLIDGTVLFKPEDIYGGSWSWLVGITSDLYPYFSIDSDSSYIMADDPLVSDEWAMLMASASLSSGKIEFWVNGILIGTAPMEAALSYADLPVYIGGASNNGLVEYGFPGHICGLAIWSSRKTGGMARFLSAGNEVEYDISENGVSLVALAVEYTEKSGLDRLAGNRSI